MIATSYAAVIEVDNSGENPDEGRIGLREELLPVLSAMPGFNAACQRRLKTEHQSPVEN
jgi:hypothetical protein